MHINLNMQRFYVFYHYFNSEKNLFYLIWTFEGFLKIWNFKCTFRKKNAVHFIATRLKKFCDFIETIQCRTCMWFSLNRCHFYHTFSTIILHHWLLHNFQCTLKYAFIFKKHTHNTKNIYNSTEVNLQISVW